MSDVAGNDEWLAGQRRSQQQSERLLAQLWAQREAPAAGRPWPDLVSQTPPAASAEPSVPPTQPPATTPMPPTQPTPRSSGRGAHRVTRTARGRRVLLVGVVVVAAGLIALGLLLLRP